MNAAQLRRALLGGATLATMGLFPLLNGLATQPGWLHWTAFDSAETLAAWCLLSAIIAATLWLPDRARWSRLRDAIHLAWLLLGALFVVAAVVKYGPLTARLEHYRALGGWTLGVLIVVVAAAAAWMVARPGSRELSRAQRAVLLLWPVIVLFLFHLVRAPLITPSHSPGWANDTPPEQPARAPLAPSMRTVIVLFDELSPDYLYGARATDLSKWPALRRVVSEGEIHRAAHLRGGATALALPVLFGPTQAAPHGLVNDLEQSGRSVRVFGWYHDYCVGMARAADVCHSTSVYNVRTLNDRFSLIDPLWTDLNLLPAEAPYEAVKTPVAVRFHRDTYEAAQAWLRDQLSDPRADVIYVHANVPHLPLLTESLHALRVPRAFVMSEQGYVTQFARVDSLLATVLDSTTRPTQLIVLSDHNARPLLPKPEHEHVVFMRMRTGHAPGQQIETRDEAAELVARMSLAPESP